MKDDIVALFWQYLECMHVQKRSLDGMRLALRAEYTAFQCVSVGMHDARVIMHAGIAN